MLPHHHRRRRSPNFPQLCAAASAALLLLLLSLSLLHSRLNLPFPTNPNPNPNPFPLFDDADNDAFDGPPVDDRIDELDLLDDHSTSSNDDDEPDDLGSGSASGSGGGLFWDHALSVARRSFARSDSDFPDPDPDLPDLPLPAAAFGSDDQPVDDRVRNGLASIRRIEHALLLDGPLREGWARWLDGKGDFLRRDRMLRSNLELLNPKNHPLLQDPDLPGVNGLTRGDRMVQNAIAKEMEKVPFGEIRIRARVRRNLHLDKGEGRRWGFYPGIDPEASFSEFVEHFFEDGRCGVRVFMVWNSPPWTFGVRHQRGLESLLRHHRDACVLVLSETMELEFFEGFVKDGFKVAVAMPDLDELLKDTPTSFFSSVWFEWRKTKHYPIHYSELIRLAALYKYGGLYLDSDVVVLKPLHSLKNSIGIEDQLHGNSTFNGAIMAFDKQSPFLKECLVEYHSTYDDTSLSWNGADLLTRVSKRLYDKGNKSIGHLDIKIEPSFSFFPISPTNITRYFVAASDETERAQEEVLFRSIMESSMAFHFWNGLTYALVPEPGSLVEKLLNLYCIRCKDLL
ncbi:uncharacterized protein M6B38_417325 [Iris pallida]|uniref:Alpha 1,4-glycosyltransferase domain-containing protein n=1 Tax=Iris pallida TaxID=29817 RepID=A0AAX6FJG1_IRIPA|nr:uncharacterized protein M6B38_417325 [Iris pallida]